MKFVKNEFNRLMKNDDGGEMLEYALIAGLIVVACIALIATVGTKLKGVWQSVGDELTAASV